jgi:hypothetical protein
VRANQSIHSDILNYNTIAIASNFFDYFRPSFRETTIHFKNNDLHNTSQAEGLGGKTRSWLFGHRTRRGFLFFGVFEKLLLGRATSGAMHHELT